MGLIYALAALRRPTPESAEIAVSEGENLVYIIMQTGQTGFNGIESLEDLRNN